MFTTRLFKRYLERGCGYWVIFLNYVFVRYDKWTFCDNGTLNLLPTINLRFWCSLLKFQSSGVNLAANIKPVWKMTLLSVVQDIVLRWNFLRFVSYTAKSSFQQLHVNCERPKYNLISERQKCIFISNIKYNLIKITCRKWQNLTDRWQSGYIRTKNRGHEPALLSISSF